MKKFTIAATAAALIALSASAQAAPGAAHVQITGSAGAGPGAIERVGFRGFRGHKFGFLRHIDLEDKCKFYLKKFMKTRRAFWFEKYEECKEDFYDHYR